MRHGNGGSSSSDGRNGSSGGQRNGSGGAGEHSALPGPPRPPAAMTPDETCLGCLIGVAVLVVSIALWAFIYWRNAEELHLPPPKSGPTVQEEIRNRVRGRGTPTPRPDSRTDESR